MNCQGGCVFRPAVSPQTRCGSFRRRSMRCFSVAKVRPNTVPPTNSPAIDLSHLKNPVKIGSTGRATANTLDMGGDVSLNTYMTLPIEQYFVLDPKKIKFLSGDRFLLLVPRINIFTVWLEPRVEVIVKQEMGPRPRIILEATNCRIQGSDIIQKWRLDERFAIKFTTELTWSSETLPVSRQLAPGTSPQPSTSTPTSQAQPTAAQPKAGGQTLQVPPRAGVPGQITASAVLEVWSEVIPPFDLMPRDLLLGSCNAVMAGLVNSLLPLFVRSLNSDYKKWAVDPQYRIDRANRSSPLTN